VSTHSADPKAIFLSYASQDAEAARRIADALRQAGIEVWFDQSELRGGEAWDASIRHQIKVCKLFVPIISAHTQAREEGYFRREWKLAVVRTLDMADDAAFLLPVVIDGTSDAEARVPEKFREVQWTRLPAGGETPKSFIERVQRLIWGGTAPVIAPPVGNVQQAPSLTVDNGVQKIPKVPVQPKPRRAPSFRYLRWAGPLLALTIVGVSTIPQWLKREHARNELLPAIQGMAATMFRSNRQIFDMATEAEKYLPNDPRLTKLWPTIATTMSIETDPGGAEVLWKDYNTPAAEWRSAGVTPLKEVKVPRDFLRVEIRRPGYQTIELATPSFVSGVYPTVARLKMDPVGALPPDMVRVPKSTNDMDVVGLGKYGPKDVPEFLIDKFEVTNKQFKSFVDAGGYANTAYWTVPVVEAGRVIPLKTALAKFTDRTGRQGPATWEAGSYLDGMENHPVTGVSWYEAAAFAAYAHKQLPAVFHWAAVADTARSEFILPMSNFSGKSTTAVGSLAGFSTFGVYDLAGNAREWTFNQGGDSGDRFILGGGWTDPVYAFNDSFVQPALDRSASNGFRCIKELSDESSVAALRQPISREFRDYSKEKPVDNATFASFVRQFAYDKTPLDAKIESTSQTEGWLVELVSIDAGYNHERLPLYIYLPKSVGKPLQPVIFFPGSDAIHESTYDSWWLNNRLPFILKGGRALIIPIYKGTYDRQDDLKSDLMEQTVRYKDHVIAWVKEFGRTIDYLETRKDMQAGEIAYLGISWGGFMGGIIPAVEKRVKAVVLNVGGMGMERSLPEVDQINYLPRVTQPVLMLNGKYDMYFPVEAAQKPMFRFLGTAPDKKKMIIYDSGHMVPQTEFIKETFAWLDTYLGPVQ
jgi:hypothetical protein